MPFHWDDDFDSPQSEVGEGTGGVFGEGLELDWQELVQDFFPDQWDWDIAESEADWYDKFGMYFWDYDPTKADVRGKLRDLEVKTWENKMIQDKDSLEFKQGTGGFITSGQDKEYEESLTELGKLEHLKGYIGFRADVLNLEEDWQKQMYEQINNIDDLGAFDERLDFGDESWGGACSTDADCRYGADCYGGQCVDPEDVVPGECEVDNDCSGIQICAAGGVCVDPDTGGDCGPGEEPCMGSDNTWSCVPVGTCGEPPPPPGTEDYCCWGWDGQTQYPCGHNQCVGDCFEC